MTVAILLLCTVSASAVNIDPYDNILPPDGLYSIVYGTITQLINAGAAISIVAGIVREYLPQAKIQKNLMNNPVSTSWGKLMTSGAQKMNKNIINVIMGFMIAMGFLGLTGFGDADYNETPATPPSVCATGIWKGTYTSSVFGPSKRATLSLIQQSAILKGKYSNSVGCIGSVSGTVSGNTAFFTISVTTPGCSGSFAGTGTINTINPVIMTFTYKGAANASCGGTDSGTGILMKQI